MTCSRTSAAPSPPRARDRESPTALILVRREQEYNRGRALAQSGADPPAVEHGTDTGSAGLKTGRTPHDHRVSRDSLQLRRSRARHVAGHAGVPLPAAPARVL